MTDAGERGTEDTGADLARASRGDDAAAVERVLSRWGPLVERYLRRHAGRRILARESATDLAQSVCREALERLGRGDLEYRGDAALKQWLFGAADLKVRNRLRYIGAQKRDAIGPVEGAPVETAPDPGPTPSVAAIRGEDREAVRAALSELNDLQREAVQLFHFEGLDHAQVAARLGLTPSHSRTLVARALARLARVLRDGAVHE